MVKPLLPCLLLFVAACSSAPTATSTASPEQAAISAYMQKTLDDPASYQSVRFSEPVPFFRRDSANLAAMDLMKSNIRTEREKGYALADGPGKDSTTQIGSRLVHTYRAKNKLGGLVLDSAAFVVYKGGVVHYNY